MDPDKRTWIRNTGLKLPLYPGLKEVSQKAFMNLGPSVEEVDLRQSRSLNFWGLENENEKSAS